MLIGLTKDKHVDVYDDADIKEFLNKDYMKHLFPVDTDASIFTCLEPCEVLKEFKKAVISFKISLYDLNRNIFASDKSEFFVDGTKRSITEITNVSDFIMFLHSLIKLHSFNQMFQTRDKYGAYLFVLTDFVMEVKYGNTKSSLKIKEKHRKLNNDFLGVLNEGKNMNTFLIPTVLLAIDDFFGIGQKHHKPQLFNSMDRKIYLNEKLTKWDTHNSFSGQTLISESLINSNAVTFVNTDVDSILGKLKMDEYTPNRRCIAGTVKICQYIEMVDEDDIPIEEPLTISAIHSMALTWFDVYDILTYPLYTPADYIEAACMAYYMLRTSAFQLDLMGNDVWYKSMLEIDFAVYKTGTDDDKFLSDDYSVTLYENDLMEQHEKDSVLKEMMTSICKFLKDVHVL